jgi:hypothetical protein
MKQIPIIVCALAYKGDFNIIIIISKLCFCNLKNLIIDIVYAEPVAVVMMGKSPKA